MYSYEVRILPVPVQSWHIARPGDFIIKSQRLLEGGDTFDHGRATYEVVYLPEAGKKRFALVRRVKSRGHRSGTKRAINRALALRVARAAIEKASEAAKCPLLSTLAAVHAKLPLEHRPRFEHEVRRLLDLYEKRV
jgi:hypothetical protein